MQTVIPFSMEPLDDDEARDFLGLEPWEDKPEDADGLVKSEIPDVVCCPMCTSFWGVIAPHGWSA